MRHLALILIVLMISPLLLSGAAPVGGDLPLDLHDLTHAGGDVHLDHGPNYPHPNLPARHAVWPGVLTLAILGLFLSAAIIGPLYRMEIPDEMPPTHSHDEPPGTSGHHGPGGTH